MSLRGFASSCLFACALGVAATAPAAAAAQSVALGPHGGVNLDTGNLHLGADVVVELTDVSPTIKLALWPSYAHVFIEDSHDVELFGVDFPFLFAIDGSILTPFVGPGLGLAFYGDTSLKLNVVGGLFIEAGSSVRPFAELALRFVDGTFVDLLAGVVFEL